MKLTRLRLTAVGLLIAMLALPAIAGSKARPGYSNDSVRGGWIWSYSGQLGSRYKFASIGVATFDGKGGCRLDLRENSGVNGGYTHTSTSCSYKVRRDGTGEATFSLDGEAGAIEFVVSPGRISFIAPDLGTVAMGEMLPLGGGSKKVPVGKWAFALEGHMAGEAVTGVGTLQISSNGKCRSSLVSTSGGGPQQKRSASCNVTATERILDLDIAYKDGSAGDLFMVVGGDGRAYLLTKARAEVIVGEASRR